MTTTERPVSEEILRALSSVPLLRTIPPEEVFALAEVSDKVQYEPGFDIMVEGERGDFIYFLVKGRVSVKRRGEAVLAEIEEGGVVGEAALLRDAPRAATVTPLTEVTALRVGREDLARVLASSEGMRAVLTHLMDERLAETSIEVPSARAWLATALRAMEARSRKIPVWEWVMYAGLAWWVLLELIDHIARGWVEDNPVLVAAMHLAIGLLVIQGACEAFVVGVERLGARLSWDGFISGTVGSMVSTLPEFVVIAFLVRVDPLAAFVTAVVTIFNNALIFSVYSFFLPKDGRGVFSMPRSLTVAGGQLLIVGAAVSLILGVIMLVLRVENLSDGLAALDLVVIGLILAVIYGTYVVALVRYYSEGNDDEESVPPDPNRLGHDTSISAISGMLGIGIVGAYCGGEAIGGFAETALGGLGLPTIPTAAALAFFAGVSEYVIVYKSHQRGELGIALSNVFGGMSQVMFLLLPCALLLIGGLGIAGVPGMMVPVNPATIVLVLLLFPLFFALQQYLALDRTLSNLDASAMTGIYFLLLYFLFTTPT